MGNIASAPTTYWNELLIGRTYGGQRRSNINPFINLFSKSIMHLIHDAIRILPDGNVAIHYGLYIQEHGILFLLPSIIARHDCLGTWPNVT